MPWHDDGFGSLPHGDFQAFGGEDTARALTAQSITESNKMIDQIERAEVAETKRSVYRALTRLRGAATSAYDGVAKTQMGNIDEYAVSNRFRATHEVRHLANDERDVKTWAFPNSRYPVGGQAPPVSFTAHTSNTTKGFWQGFFSGVSPDGSAATGQNAVVQAFDSAITESRTEGEALPAKPQEKPDGRFWAHFFEEEQGQPDHK